MPPDHLLDLTWRDGATDHLKFWYRPADPASGLAHDERHMYAWVQDSLIVAVQRANFDHVLAPREFLQ